LKTKRIWEVEEEDRGGNQKNKRKKMHFSPQGSVPRNSPFSKRGWFSLSGWGKKEP